MRILLDTQVALWWLTGDTRLKRGVRERIATFSCYLSVASIWEVAIKHRLGKLPVAPDVFAQAMRSCGATVLSLDESHAASYAQLAAGHDDPFDLILIAVAQVEKLCLLTADRKLLGYANAQPALTVEAAA